MAMRTTLRNTEHLRAVERAAKLGRTLRAKLPRRELGRWQPARRRADPLAILRAAEHDRIADLLPIKYARMAVSAFGFFRGSAGVMAADLGARPHTGLLVQICGDAHVRNLGAYAAPDGHLVFDINDFDESIRAPWEWDLQRLAASFVLAGREAGASDRGCRDAVERLSASYREAMHRFAAMPYLDLIRYEVRRHLDEGPVRLTLAKARRATRAEVLTKLTAASRGHARFAHRPPLLTGVSPRDERAVLRSLAAYRDSLTPERQLVLDVYHPVDVAFKVVGTGSVGSRDYVVLCCGRGPHDPLFLQVKQEFPSVYAPFVRYVRAARHDGERVAQGQRRMQTVSDPLIGWTSIGRRPYLVRQLSDHKAAVDPAHLRGAGLGEFALVCGEVFAKAHARTGNAAAIASYCGGSPRLDEALARFAMAYADQATADYEHFLKAIRRRSATRAEWREAR